MEKVMLNLGSGSVPLAGYRNIDIKSGETAYPLDVLDGSVDEIRASHLLEHFGHEQVKDVVTNWASKLKPGGTLKIAVPDFATIVKMYNDGQVDHLQGYVCGGHIDENDYHKCIFDKGLLTGLLQDVGLVNVREWRSEVGDCSSLPVSLNIAADKPAEVPVAAPAAAPTTVMQTKTVKVAAVMSIPRLIFSDNIFCAVQAIIPLGISLDRGQGVYWGQVLTRMIEKHLETDYIIVLDYDTWFRREHVVRLLQLAQEHPEFDAFVPVQAKREESVPLFGILGKEGEKEVVVPVKQFLTDCCPIDTGHFGLTVFRTEVFNKMPKPWFCAHPAPDNTWGEGRIDADISFWNTFKAAGLKAALCNNVKIGHLQMMCSFPGDHKNEWKPTHIYCNDLQKDEIVAPYVPHVEYMT